MKIFDKSQVTLRAFYTKSSCPVFGANRIPLKLPGDFETVVAGTVIHDDNFQLQRVVLQFQNSVDDVAQGLSLVITGNDE